MEQQELFLKLSMFEQQIQNLQKQHEAIENGILELDSIKLNLDELNGGKDKEILAQLGRGIFVRAKITSEDLLVDLGEGKFVKRDIKGTKKLLEKQVIRLREFQVEIEKSLEKLNEELSNTMEDFHKKK